MNKIEKMINSLKEKTSKMINSLKEKTSKFLEALRRFWSSRTNRWNLLAIILTSLEVYIFKFPMSPEQVLFATLIFSVGGLILRYNTTTAMSDK